MTDDNAATIIALEQELTATVAECKATSDEEVLLRNKVKQLARKASDLKEKIEDARRPFPDPVILRIAERLHQGCGWDYCNWTKHGSCYTRNLEQARTLYNFEHGDEERTMALIEII